MLVELIYDTDCPNVEASREALREAFRIAGLQPAWTEWDRTAPDGPAYAQRYGSPTILVNGRDIAGAPGNEESCCRLYNNGGRGLEGVPSAERIAEALSARGQPN